jgi:ketosteroid isomerase-like protein
MGGSSRRTNVPPVWARREDVSEVNARDVFEAYLKATNARDVDALEAIVHEDFEDVYPQSGERTVGLANLRAILDNYPEGGFEGLGTGRIVGSEDRWVLTPAFSVLRIEGTGDTYTGVSRGRYPDGTEWYVVTISEVRDGRVRRSESYFAPAFEPPAWRAAWVVRD